MIRGVVRTAARQRVGSRAALGLSSCMRVAGRNFGAFTKIREFFMYPSRPSRATVPALASMPLVAQPGSTEEAIAHLPTVSEFASAAVTNEEVTRTLSQIAADHYLPVRAVMHLLDTLHSTGLTWVACIALLTVSLRAFMVPLLVYSSKVSVRMAQMKPDLEEITADFNRKKALNYDARQNSMEYSQGMLNLYKKHNCHPLSAMVMPLVSMPVFMSCFFGLLAMCTEGVPGMAREGAFWFPDLTAQDPYYILPIISSWAGVLVLKRGSEQGGMVDPKMAPFIKAFTVMGLCAPVLTYHLPSGVLVYFSAMSVVSVLQGEVMRADATRRLMNLPTLSEMRILKSVGKFSPFKDEGIPQSLDPNSSGQAEDASKKSARKKPLPLPSRRR